MPPPDKGLIYRYLGLSVTVQQSYAIITGCYGKLFCQAPRSGWGSRNLNETDLEIDSAICSMVEALSPVDVNLCYSEAFQHPSSPNKKAEKFNIHLSMALLLKVLSKCNTCCQSWIEPRIVRNNREMAFRSIIKLCYKCHPSRGMEFMHTYYYPGNSKGSADPLAWKQYNLSFSFFSNSFWAIKFKNPTVHYNLWGCSTSQFFRVVVLRVPLLFFRSAKAKLQTIFWWEILTTLYVQHDFGDGVCKPRS